MDERSHINFERCGYHGDQNDPLCPAVIPPLIIDIKSRVLCCTGRLCRLSGLVKGIFREIFDRYSRLGAHDEPCSFAMHSQKSRRSKLDDAIGGTSVCSVFQLSVSTQRYPLGGAIPVVSGSIRVLLASPHISPISYCGRRKAHCGKPYSRRPAKRSETTPARTSGPCGVPQLLFGTLAT